jgi:imidazolonepropionase
VNYYNVTPQQRSTRKRRIRYLGPAAEAPVDSADVVIDGAGLVALPGLVDCHTHAVWAGTRAAEFAERLRGVPYVEILERGGGEG